MDILGCFFIYSVLLARTGAKMILLIFSQWSMLETDNKFIPVKNNRTVEFCKQKTPLFVSWLVDVVLFVISGNYFKSNATLTFGESVSAIVLSRLDVELVRIGPV